MSVIIKGNLIFTSQVAFFLFHCLCTSIRKVALQLALKTIELRFGSIYINKTVLFLLFVSALYIVKLVSARGSIAQFARGKKLFKYIKRALRKQAPDKGS